MEVLKWPPEHFFLSFVSWNYRLQNQRGMKDLNIKGELLINPANGDVKVLKKDGRLAFPLQIVVAGTERREHINSYSDLLRLIRAIRRSFISGRHPKSRVIQEKINIHLRSLHEPA